jgi:uncharacterized protein involved in type VI secretion and phage assembly
MMNVMSDEKYFGVYRGIVADSDLDPYGRVQVTVPMVGNESLWAMVVVPITGQHAVVPPAAGTQVVVAYEAGDPSFPYVLGTAFSPNSTAAPAATASNEATPISPSPTTRPRQGS